MKSVSECIICRSRALKSRKGSVAPFVAFRIWGRDAFSVQLLQCAECGFAFFNPRLEPAEEQRLYADYRSAAYQRMRYSFEPWYTESFHSSLFSEATMRSRRENLKRILAPYLRRTKVRSILDFGGGRGELISDLCPGADRCVFDVSDPEPLPGIEKLVSLSDCKKHRYDLIVCSNVLEHVAFPREILHEMVEVAAPGALLFVEVPFQPPFSYGEQAKRLGQAAILMVTRTRIGLSLLKTGVLNVMHEHVNFFSAAAMERLMASAGLQIQASGMYGENSLKFAKMLWTLASRKTA